jgi:hypothetical protein
MQGFINFLTNYNVVPQQSVHFHGNERFSNIFFDKFKNLLDDYIVNYQVKYFFYILFISFFYLELSEGMFQLLHNYSPYHLSLFGSFIIDLCSSLVHSAVIDFMYSYFAFNLNSISYLISLFSNHNFAISIVVMGMLIFIVAECYEHFKHDTSNFKFMAFLYFIHSFFFFLLFYINFCSLGFYLSFTLGMVLLYYAIVSVIRSELDNMISLIIVSMILAPYYLLFLLSLYVVYYVLNKYVPLFDRKHSSVYKMELATFGDLLMIGVLGFYIIPLHYAYASSALFIINSFPFYLAIFYAYRNEEYDSRG